MGPIRPQLQLQLQLQLPLKLELGLGLQVQMLPLLQLRTQLHLLLQDLRYRTASQRTIRNDTRGQPYDTMRYATSFSRKGNTRYGAIRPSAMAMRPADGTMRYDMPENVDTRATYRIKSYRTVE